MKTRIRRAVGRSRTHADAARLWLAPKGLPGQFRAPLELHRGLDRLDALASRSNGLTERIPEPLIGFDQLRVLIRRGNRRF